MGEEQGCFCTCTTEVGAEGTFQGGRNLRIMLSVAERC